MMEKIVDGMMNEQKAKEEKKENKKADKK